MVKPPLDGVVVNDPLADKFNGLGIGQSTANAALFAASSVSADTAPAVPMTDTTPMSIGRTGNAADLLVRQYMSEFPGAVEAQPSDVIRQTQSYLQFINFFHPHICTFIRRLNRSGIPDLLKLGTQQLDNDTHTNGKITTVFKTEYDPGSIVYRQYPRENVDFDDGAYSLYNWELFFHAPMLIATQLSANQQFEDAQTWFHYIFNPTTQSKETSAKRYWNTLPFHDNSDPERDQIQNLLTALASPSTDPSTQAIKDQVQAQITAWQNDPFNPHLIARMRVTAYQKNVVFKYIDNLIAWGDQLFTQNTLETINEATLLYVLAYNILGPRPQVIPSSDDIQPQTYAQLKSRLDGFSNALVSLENEGVTNLTAQLQYSAYPAVSPVKNLNHTAVP